MSNSEYRWNQAEAARAYDAAAPMIHPQYLNVQDAVFAALPFECDQPFRAIDLGGGSGRLMERLLSEFSAASGIVIDQSAPFLEIAKERLASFNGRAACVERRLQNDWQSEVAPVEAIVSTSAIHHLATPEKVLLFDKCFAALSPGGVLINGDEHRPDSEDEFRQLLESWGRHMDAALAAGQIPESFGGIIAAWKKRNLEQFGAPKVSGEDCHETIEGEVKLLNQAGFVNVRVTWHEQLWAVIVARKP